MGMGDQRHAPAALSPGKRTRTHCTGGRVGPRTCLHVYRISRSHRDSIPGPFNRFQVAIPTTLSDVLRGVNANRNKIIINGPTPKTYTTLYSLTNAGLWTPRGEFLCSGITQSINTSCYNTRLATHLHNSWTADGQWIYSCYTNVIAAINTAQFVFTWQRQLAMRNVLIHFHCCVLPLLVKA